METMSLNDSSNTMMMMMTTTDTMLSSSHETPSLSSWAEADSTTTPVSDDFSAAFYNTARFVTGLICYPTICFFGLVGNLLILVVFSRKSMSTSTNVLLSALAVSDTIKLINDLLYFITCLLLTVAPESGNCMFAYLYPYAHFIFNVSACVSSWLTVFVAIERYMLVCHPARSKGITSVYRAKLVSIAVFTLMTIFAVPSLLRYRTVTVTTTSESGVNVTRMDINLTELWRNERFVSGYNWIQSLLRSIIPLVILVFTSYFIINSVRQTRANKKLASRNRITVMLSIVILFFLVCIIPDAVMSALYLGYAESDSNLVKGIREITDTLLVINAAINFALYFVFNQTFRKQFLAIFCRYQEIDTGDNMTSLVHRTGSKQSHHCNNKKQLPTL